MKLFSFLRRKTRPENTPEPDRFPDLLQRESVFLYAGDVPPDEQYAQWIGLSLTRSNENHLRHDVTKPYPLPDCCVDRYQAEDVFEHIELEKLPAVVNEIYRILKPGGNFRLSVPDYRCDVLIARSEKNERGEIVFDRFGGGQFENGQVVDGGHLWFPTYEVVREMLSQTLFTDISFLHYYDEDGRGILHEIDYSIGHVKRTPDHDERVQNPRRPMSIVVDCRK